MPTSGVAGAAGAGEGSGFGAGAGREADMSTTLLRVMIAFSRIGST